MPEMLTSILSYLLSQLPGAMIGASFTHYFSSRRQQAVLREERFRAGTNLVGLMKDLIKVFADMREQLDRAVGGNYLVSYIVGAGEGEEKAFLPKPLSDALAPAREQASLFGQNALSCWQDIHLAIVKAETKFKTAKNTVRLEPPRELPDYRESLSRVLRCLFGLLHAMQSRCAPDTEGVIDHLLLDEGKE